MTESKNSFNAKQKLEVGEKSYDYFALSAVPGMEKLPYSLKVLGENLLRTEDGANITTEHIEAIANWDPTAEPSIEIQFTPARVLMQDFTGVPCVVDLATMREAVKTLGGDPEKVNPLNPAEMVIDHSLSSRPSVPPTPWLRTLRSSTSATRSAISSCAGAPRRSPTSASFLREPASSTRSTSRTWHASSSTTRA